jgi:hypothetical protein
MPLRVRHSGRELVLADEHALAALYRVRRVLASDLVWHPGRGRWIRIDAFLFLDASDSSPRTGRRASSGDHGSGGPERPRVNGNGSSDGSA